MGEFYAYLLLFQGAMVGIVLSNNVLLLLIFWELTSLSSFLLIGYWKHLPEGRQGARMALAVTAMGGLAMIAGMLILGDIAGSYDITEILRHGDAIKARSEEHTSELQSLMRISYAVFCLKKKKPQSKIQQYQQ